MSLRNLAIDIAFDAELGKIMAVDSAVDGIKDSAIDAGGSVDELAGVSETASSSILDNFTKVGDGMQGIGKKMTIGITAPLVALGTAIAGTTAALGWKRLVGLDTAQSQLQGLGYTTEEVGRISEQVTTAIDGGMTTMAEGTAVAAGALAAGVDEGENLERYIKLVGDAAVGANRPVDDMAQIFNRVQGSGKLMTQELNMIEQGMPGFATAMAESLGVAPEEFRKMVTAGEVSSDHFLDVMDDFAGGMAEAYSNSWEGMVKNTGAYIGIIGEQILGGVFEESKEAIAGFIEILKSDEVMAWAESMGQKIGDSLTTIIDKVKTVKGWFDDLNPGVKDIIGKFVLFGTITATAIGPLLMIFGKIFSTIAPLIGFFGKLIGLVKGAGGAFALLSNPIGWVVAAIGLLVGAFILAYNKVEWFRDALDTAWAWITEAISVAFEWIYDIIMNVFGAAMEFAIGIVDQFREFWDTHSEFIVSIVEERFNSIVGTIQMVMGIIQGIFEIVWPIVSGIVQIAWGIIQTSIQNAIDIVLGIIGAAMSLLQGDWQGAWDAIFGIVTNIWDNILGFFQGVDLYQVGADILQGLIDGISSMASAVWGKIEEIAEGIKSKFSWVLEIFSPSRAFKRFGIDTMMGYTIGFEDESESAIDAAENAAIDISDVFDDDRNPSQPDVPHYPVSDPKPPKNDDGGMPMPIMQFDFHFSKGDEEEVKQAAAMTKREFKKMWYELQQELDVRTV